MKHIVKGYYEISTRHKLEFLLELWADNFTDAELKAKNTLRDSDIKATKVVIESIATRY